MDATAMIRWTALPLSYSPVLVGSIWHEFLAQLPISASLTSFLLINLQPALKNGPVQPWDARRRQGHFLVSTNPSAIEAKFSNVGRLIKAIAAATHKSRPRSEILSAFGKVKPQGCIWEAGDRMV